ncbi:uncharacterized protein MELLADRAFT_123759 [Melampsora larici-populina 98AG31]|uniref:Secreted protein n=1 Tax=Melampsora larici-populina (strain 98AG31 / pathotype 3-4-7) TaxID=747676 RepID=F4RN47_MELLP|nr:uncharacterized protein MELLADRAFT_123759 [Melampsora larici-populina 98AG31]EGG06282.1 secreted protein [Melampsora larici-populina 98AG31]
MLQSFLKISTSLLSLWIYSSNVATVASQNVECNVGFSLKSGGKGVCKHLGSSSIDTYHCPYSRCWCQNHQWIPISACRLRGSGVPGTSSQQCATYDLVAGNSFNCKNPGGIAYTCHPERYPPVMICDTCTWVPDS